MSAYAHQMERAISAQSLSSRGGSELGSQYVIESVFYMKSFTATIFISGLEWSCDEFQKLNDDYSYCKIFTLHAELNGLEADEFPASAKVVLIDIDDIFTSSPKCSDVLMDRIDQSWCTDCIQEAKHTRHTLTLRLFMKLRTSGWSVILFSRKHEGLRDVTTNLLISVGYRGWSSLIMRLDDEMQMDSREYLSRRMTIMHKDGFRITVHGHALMHQMSHPGSRQNDHQFELTHPNPNSTCVACGYQCLTLQDTYGCKACNIPVHVECLTGVSRKPVPLCSPSGPSWTPPVASVETPQMMMPSSLSSTHPAHYAYNNPVPPMFPPYLYNHQGPPSQYYAYNYPPPMFPPHPHNHQGPPPQAPVMPPYPYPYNHPGNTQKTGNGGNTQNTGNGDNQGNTQNTGNGNNQGNTQNTENGNHQGNTQNAGNGNHQGNTQNTGNGNNQGNTQNAGNGNNQGNTQNAGNGNNQGNSSTGKKILNTLGRFAVPLVIASVFGVDVDDLDLPFLSEEDQSVNE
ncbi:hypothetical protein LWI28_024535 [Acer negundo]|uniref:Phorbol-ester/DAG-type domain-containing protein n=1 Tax=Acer negundo TaxID=4023 RepID=A0AAD5IBK5_ACENE|nr:hypothetical protein LWI28_024535 [Acer negundo]